MSSAAEEHVLYQIANAPIRVYPYPHVYVPSVFPPDFYDALRRHWPDAGHLVSLEATGRVSKGAYPERFIMPLNKKEVDKLPEAARQFWTEFGSWLLDGRFLYALVDKFDASIRRRFGEAVGKVRFSPEVLVVRDHTNYKIGPHTDAPHRLMSLLFYCPDDDRYRHLGTSIYTPNDPEFRCAGGPHHPHSQFTRVATMPYLPNALFAFVKTDNSFHGVDPIRDADVLRDLILYDIRVEQPDDTASRTSGSIGAKMLKQMFSFSR